LQVFELLGIALPLLPLYMGRAERLAHLALPCHGIHPGPKKIGVIAHPFKSEKNRFPAYLFFFVAFFFAVFLAFFLAAMVTHLLSRMMV